MHRLIQKRCNFVAENQERVSVYGLQLLFNLKRKHYEKGIIRSDGHDCHRFYIVWKQAGCSCRHYRGCRL